MPDTAAAQQPTPDELARSIESQDQFMSFLSHEIRGGLNGATLLLEVVRRDLMRRGDGLKDLVADVESVRNTVLHTAAMMERALFADRIRRGRVEPEVTSVELAPLLEQALAKARKNAKDKDADVTIEPTSAAVETDPALLTRALVELFDNAIKFSTGPVTASVRSADSAHTLGIAHPASPLSPDQIAHLLSPHRRPSSAEKGVGLVTVVQIARLLRLPLEASSDPSRTEFRLVLPKR